VRPCYDDEPAIKVVVIRTSRSTAISLSLLLSGPILRCATLHFQAILDLNILHMPTPVQCCRPSNTQYAIPVVSWSRLRRFGCEYAQVHRCWSRRNCACSIVAKSLLRQNVPFRLIQKSPTVHVGTRGASVVFYR